MSDRSVADRRVHPATVALRFVKELPSSLLGLPAAYTFMNDVGWGTVLAFVAAIALAMGLVNWFAWSRFRYGIGAREIVIESGILTRNRRSIPFDRIQDVDIERGLLQRLFGLAKVRIETGGSASDEGVLDSVTLEEAARVRATVRAWRSGTEEEAAVDPRAEAPPAIFAMSTGRVLMAGVFNFSMVYLAGIFALLQSFSDWLPFDLNDPARWLGSASAEAGRFSPGAVAAVLAIALLLGSVTGIARTVARDHGFRLTAEGRRLRRERGLFTRTEAVIPLARVQLARVSTGPVRRAFGWAGLAFQTLGGASGGEIAGSQDAAPFASRDEIAAVLAEERRLRLPDASSMRMISRRHVLRSIVRTLLLPALAICALSLAEPLVLWLLAGLPLLGLGAVLARRFHLYGRDGGLLFVARGFWKQQLWIVPVESTQAVSLTRSPLQRLLGLASLAVDTAGAPVLGGARIVDLRLDDARALYEELSASVSRAAAATQAVKAAPPP